MVHLYYLTYAVSKQAILMILWMRLLRIHFQVSICASFLHHDFKMNVYDIAIVLRVEMVCSCEYWIWRIIFRLKLTLERTAATRIKEKRTAFFTIYVFSISAFIRKINIVHFSPISSESKRKRQGKIRTYCILFVSLIHLFYSMNQ